MLLYFKLILISFFLFSGSSNAKEVHCPQLGEFQLSYHGLAKLIQLSCQKNKLAIEKVALENAKRNIGPKKHSMGGLQKEICIFNYDFNCNPKNNQSITTAISECHALPLPDENLQYTSENEGELTPSRICIDDTELKDFSLDCGQLPQCNQRHCDISSGIKNLQLRGKLSVYRVAPGKLNSLNRKDLKDLYLDSLKNLFPDQLKQIIKENTKRMSSAQLRKIYSEQLKDISPNTISYLPEDQLRREISNSIERLPPDQLKQIISNSLDSSSTNELQQLVRDHFKDISSDKLVQLKVIEPVVTPSYIDFNVQPNENGEMVTYNFTGQLDSTSNRFEDLASARDSSLTVPMGTLQFDALTIPATSSEQDKEDLWLYSQIESSNFFSPQTSRTERTMASNEMISDLRQQLIKEYIKKMKAKNLDVSPGEAEKEVERHLYFTQANATKIGDIELPRIDPNWPPEKRDQAKISWIRSLPPAFFEFKPVDLALTQRRLNHFDTLDPETKRGMGLTQLAAPIINFSLASNRDFNTIIETQLSEGLRSSLEENINTSLSQIPSLSNDYISSYDPATKSFQTKVPLVDVDKEVRDKRLTRQIEALIHQNKELTKKLQTCIPDDKKGIFSFPSEDSCTNIEKTLIANSKEIKDLSQELALTRAGVRESEALVNTTYALSTINRGNRAVQMRAFEYCEPHCKNEVLLPTDPDLTLPEGTDLRSRFTLSALQKYLDSAYDQGKLNYCDTIKSRDSLSDCHNLSAKFKEAPKIGYREGKYYIKASEVKTNNLLIGNVDIPEVEVEPKVCNHGNLCLSVVNSDDTAQKISGGLLLTISGGINEFRDPIKEKFNDFGSNGFNLEGMKLQSVTSDPSGNITLDWQFD